MDPLGGMQEWLRKELGFKQGTTHSVRRPGGGWAWGLPLHKSGYFLSPFILTPNPFLKDLSHSLSLANCHCGTESSVKALAVNSLECSCSQKSLHSTVGVRWGGVWGSTEGGEGENLQSPMTCTLIIGFRHDRLGKERIWEIGRAIS